MSETSGEAISSECDDMERRRRRFRWWPVVLILLVLLALGLLSRRLYWRWQFEARVAALEAAGYPVRAEQLEAMYPPLAPGQANAADLLREAAELYRDSLSVQEVKLLPLAGDGEMPARGQPMPPDVKEIVTRFLDENREGVERVHRAVRLDACRYPVPWSFDDAANWSLHRTYRSGSLLCLSALQSFDDGQAEAAVDALIAALRLARFVRQVPTLSAMLTYIEACDDVAVTLEWGLGRGSLADGQLHRLQQAIGESDRPETMAQALACHRCMLLPGFRRLERYPNRLPRAPIAAVYGAMGLPSRDGTLFIDVAESYIDVTRKTMSRWQAEMTQVQTQWEPRLRRSMLLADMAEGGFSGALRIWLSRTARIECVRAALAVERHRLAQGALPEALADCAPGLLENVPADPFTGRELRYERLRSGFVVYSVGEDGRDDGGWEPPSRSQRALGQTYDITFGVER